MRARAAARRERRLSRSAVDGRQLLLQQRIGALAAPRAAAPVGPHVRQGLRAWPCRSVSPTIVGGGHCRSARMVAPACAHGARCARSAARAPGRRSGRAGSASGGRRRGRRAGTRCSSACSTSSGVAPGRQAGAVGDAEDVRVHRHRRLAEGHVEHHVGGLAAHAGQGLAAPRACAAPRRHAARPADAAGLRSGCCALVRNRPMVRMCSVTPSTPSASIVCGVRRQREQPARGLVDADVGGLRRQQHGGQQLEHAGVTRVRSAGCGLAAASVAKKRSTWSSVMVGRAGAPVGGRGARRSRGLARASARFDDRALGAPAAVGVGDQRLCAARSASLAWALAARRSSFSRCSRSVRNRWKA